MDDGELLNSVEPHRISESQLSSKLNHSCGSGGIQPRSQNAGRRLFHVENRAESRIGTPVIRESEIGMIQHVEKLKADRQGAIFPTRNLSVLHHCEIGIEVRRDAKAVS